MAQFLSTSHISAKIEDIIGNANQFLVLISPYLKINNRIKADIKELDNKGFKIHIIYGKKQIDQSELTWLKSLTSVNIQFMKELHAKCYLNENEAVIASMNLYDYSQVNNYEMGIYVTKDDDPGLYKDIREESIKIFKASSKKDFTDTIPPKEKHAPPKQKQAPKQEKVPTSTLVPASTLGAIGSYIKEAYLNFTNKGYCIRCGTLIEFNPDRPYCYDCWLVWYQYKNESHPEEFCHFCGDDYNTIRLKPLCNDCYYSD